MVSLAASQQSAYDPWAVQNRIGLTDARLSLDSMLMPVPNLSYIDYRSGVMASGDTGGVGGSGHMALRVRAAGGFGITVEMGNAVINTPGQGAYMCANDSQKSFTLASPSLTASRIDLVVARVHDDRNTAIGSAEGDRGFFIEVWQGDTATTNPVQPVPTVAQGWTPLAAVHVNKGALAITSADITDLRGPGLVARGGMRALYGADAQPGSAAFNEPGAYPGDQRYVHNVLFQHQVYYGSGSDPTKTGWRGVHNCLVFNANPGPGGILWTRGLNSTRELCRVTVPYPGTPFMIYPTARAFLRLSQATAVDVRVTLGSTSGSTVNWTRADNFGVTWDRDTVTPVPPIMWGPFTSGTDVVLSAAIRELPYPEAGFGYAGDWVGQTLLSVNVYPSTVPPPAV